MPWKYKADKDRYRLQQARDHPEKVMWSSAKCRAKKRGLEFNIEVSDIVIPEYCPILGIRIETARDVKGPRWNSPTLDRRDNTLGYVRGNVAVISSKANACKSDLTKEQIRSLARYVDDER